MIIGMTESGKTTYAVNLAHKYKEFGIKTIVLDPLLDERWRVDFLTDDYDEFIEVITHPETKNCAAFIDESGESAGTWAYITPHCVCHTALMTDG